MVYKWHRKRKLSQLFIQVGNLGCSFDGQVQSGAKVIDMTYTSQDEVETAAIKTVELDATLRGHAV